MIKKILFISVIIFASCGSSKKVVQNTKPSNSSYKTRSVKHNTTSNSNKVPALANKVVWTAVTYKGTPYKYAGVSKKGMDCSGLIYTSFKTRGINLPRSSSMLYTKGHSIASKKARRGDLLFFKTTNKSKSKINHVGLVTSTDNGDVKFIHASSSKGVIVSSLSQSYWSKSFIEAKRIID